MSGQGLNRMSGMLLIALSATALLTVVMGWVLYAQRALPADEGALAHIFQLSVAATLPVGLLFLSTADWSRPLRAMRFLALPGVFLMLAFIALYLLEHRG